jgi:poly(hydroxyalkanoate) depolymerase family esterase
MVVLLHGCTQDPDDLARGAHVASHADRSGVLVLLPEQPEAANPRKCWNWYDPAHQQRERGEPSIVAGMTRQIMRQWSVDSERVYVAGISAGAAMASVLAITYPDVFAAAALHSGIPYGAATNVMAGVTVMSNGAADTTRLARAAYEAMGAKARPLPVLIVHGADDPIVKRVNATQTRDAWLAMNAMARGDRDTRPAQIAEAGRAFEAEAGGLRFERECHGARLTQTTCEVETLIVHGLGHAWSGGSKLGSFTDARGPDATAEIMRFLLAHRLTSPPPTRR